MQQTTQRRLLAGVAAVGVLGAGALATAVNASILDSGPTPEAEPSSILLPATTTQVALTTPTPVTTPTGSS